MTIARSFAPIVGTKPQILILGSSPGQISLQKQQYFAHPRNAFWPILANLFQFDATSSYQKKVEICKVLPIVIWDVLAQCERQGSLDSAIQKHTQELNDFSKLLEYHPSLHSVYCNGATAYHLFVKKVLPLLKKDLNVQQLPSTSPAHARLSFAQKMQHWSVIKQSLS